MTAPMRLGYDDRGARDAPVVVLGSGLGTRRSAIEGLARLLESDHRVITVDLPGHGTSSPVTEAYRLEDAADAVLAVLDEAGVDSFSHLGVSVSGAIGQALALAAPRRVSALFVCASAAHWPDQEQWGERAERVRREGVGFMAPSRRGVWFSERFAAQDPERARALVDELVATDAASYAYCCDAIRAFDARGRLGAVESPTVVVVGRFDTATPLPLAEELHVGIPGAHLQVVPDGYHLLQLEHAELLAALVRGAVPPIDVGAVA